MFVFCFCQKHIAYLLMSFLGCVFRVVKMQNNTFESIEQKNGFIIVYFDLIFYVNRKST